MTRVEASLHGSESPEPARASLLRLVLGDQLNEQHTRFSQLDAHVLTVMMEIIPEVHQVWQHIQKIVAVLGAMRLFAERLRELGHRVLYLPIDDSTNRQSFIENLAWIAAECGAGQVEIQEPEDYRLKTSLAPHTVSQALSTALGRRIDVVPIQHEHFLIASHEDSTFLRTDNKPVMEYFYRRVRRHYGWLLDQAGKPVGGSWNYDTENRAAWSGPPTDPRPPEPYRVHRDSRDLKAAVERAGCSFFGHIDARDFPWPLTRTEALGALDHFLTHGLPFFGTYQDAMSSRETVLFHSRLSFALNVKLLSPKEVVESAIETWKRAGAGDSEPGAHPIGLNQIEGFVRQIAGWREYMRLLYRRMMPELAASNALGADRPLPPWYWSGETDMNCVAQAIGASLHGAYAHHIQRLMVTGAFAMMAGIEPNEIDAWYLGIYIDAFDWVERPNTRGMSQYADGGVIATKPYAATARYMRRQSDYCAKCRYDPETRAEPDSCPFNSLYWDFYARNRMLEGNRRIRFVYSALSRMSDEERRAISSRAGWIRDHLGEL